MSKRGRPIKENKRDKQYRVRFTREEFDELSYYSAKKGRSIAETIRKGINLQLELDENTVDDS